MPFLHTKSHHGHEGIPWGLVFDIRYPISGHKDIDAVICGRQRHSALHVQGRHSALFFRFISILIFWLIVQ
jgi:hypothetical protein